MHWLIYEFAGLNDLSSELYVGAASLLGLAIWLVAHFVIFWFGFLWWQMKRQHRDFEYDIRRSGLKAFVHLMIAVLISVEIWACYLTDSLRSGRYYLPLWVVFVFSSGWAIWRVLPFRQRAALLRKLEKI